MYLTGYKLFAKQKLENNPDVDSKEMKKQAIAAWKKLNRAGKYFYEKKAKQHNDTLPPRILKEENKRPKKSIQLTALLQLTI